ncbi:Hypothetical protein LUCI_2646 [Lucifera butyrica]|uniref:Uncharacterized protein n=1 Tax=Lucifera butyrica TaxID=1351585 RepID=A0A498R7P6_9FIRM|nr:CBO0543 family protein [Lucifera butyrica]VBB07401.1 Hypothetical protein LUCI_2646 [Lucifera butyrica]
MFFATSGISADIPIQKLITSIRIDEWLQEDLFHFRWWILIGIFTFSAFIWCKNVDKTRLPEITLCAGFTTIATLILDEFGEELTMWDYPTDVLPLFPPLTAIDLASLPIIYSLIYQRFKTWKSFLWASIVMSAIFSFVFEPLLAWGGIYQLLKWKYYYGFPIYVILALFIKWLVTKIYAIAKEAGNAR